MLKFELPVELKKALIDRKISFTRWCKEKGFNKSLAQRVANNPYRDFSNAPKQRLILETLKKEFPEIFQKTEREKK